MKKKNDSTTNCPFLGAMANVVDIAPNFAGPVLAFAQTIHMSASFLSPLANFQMLDKQEHLMSAWRTVFYVSCFVACGTYISFQLWGTGEVSAITLNNILSFFIYNTNTILFILHYRLN